MRKIIVSGLLILLSGCATTTNNYYSQAIQSWNGGSANTLLKRWGIPNTKVISPSGNTVYVYNTVSYAGSNERASAPVGVHFNGERPVIVNTPNTNFATSNNGLSAPCVAVFMANKHGTIIDTQVHGNACYGDSNFLSDKSNPDKH